MKKVLFVCLGNICRSPAAEGIFKKMITENGLKDKVLVDSAGTLGYHAGEPPDERMSKHALQRGYTLDHQARGVTINDLDKFDYIVTMDNDNYKDVKLIDRNNEYAHKIFKLAEFCEDKSVKFVPDPYFGGSAGFEQVLDIIEDGTKGLLNKIKNDIEQQYKNKN